MAAKKDEKDVVADAAAEQMTGAGKMAEHGQEQAVEASRRQSEQMRSLLGTGTRLYSDMGEVSRGDVDNLLETGARIAKGAQEVGWEMVHYTQQSLQASLRAANQMMTCRTVEDMLNVQRNFVRESMDSFMQESVKLLELSTGGATEAAQSMQQRMDIRQ
jgi:hypothetical protein